MEDKIFDMLAAPQLAVYWNTWLTAQSTSPFLGEQKFPSQQKMGLDLKYIKGGSGVAVALKPSAFDAKAPKRDRIGLKQMMGEMPFFKEGMDVNEELMQQLLLVMETGNQGYIDVVVNQIFNDQRQLLEAAAVQRERMRMSALTTGIISIESNGQELFYDYGIPDDQKVDAAVAWSNPAADIAGEVLALLLLIEETTGVRPTEAVCDLQTWGWIKKNTSFIATLYPNNTSAFINDRQMRQFFQDEFQLTVEVYSKRYKETRDGPAIPFVAPGTFVVMPEGPLGTGWFGTTPEEARRNANVGSMVVEIVEGGVAISSYLEPDPVNTTTKVSQVFLPSFEEADKVGIIDTNP